MSSTEKPTTRATLGLGGLTMNAMALIAPGAFLWLTFFIQSSYGAPMAAQGMWFGIFAALLLCLATAISYAECRRQKTEGVRKMWIPTTSSVNFLRLCAVRSTKKADLDQTGWI